MANLKHGHSRTESVGKVSPTYGSWRSMIARCVDPKSPSFAHYGARGVKVCDRWQAFALFLEDMGERPSGTTIDRIDNTRGYEPGNCRWATHREQQNNKTNNVPITAFGKTLTYSQWEDECGIEQSVLRNRIVNLGWPAEKALTVKDGRLAPTRKPRTHCFRGHELTPENTIYCAVRPERRACRTCKTISNRLSYERKREREAA